MRKSSIVATVFAMFALTLPTVAHAAGGAAAAPYGAARPAVETSGAIPETGGPLTLTATGFCPGETVVFTIGFDKVGSAPANVQGTAVLVLSKYVPDKNHTVVATTKNGENCAATASTELVVTKTPAVIPVPAQAASDAVLPIIPAGAVAAAILPTTGSDTSSPLQIGGMVLFAGVGLVGVSAFRRRTNSRGRTAAS